MTEKEKAQAGYLYDANYDKSLLSERVHCAELVHKLNSLSSYDTENRRTILRELLGKIPDSAVILSPFNCDYGYNISVGENFFSNYNCTILDGTSVTFGDNVFIAPNCCFSTAGHAIDAEQRNKGLEIAWKITVGDNVWIGANVVVLPGVTIGSNTIIGAGSVVTKDIPSGVIAVGNPCRVMREITEQDKYKYKMTD